MSLFNSIDFKEAKKDYSHFCKENKNKYISSTNDFLHKHIGEIKQGYTYHATSNGKWAVYNLIGYILKQIGTSDIIKTTYAISQEAVIYYNRIYKRGLINKMIYVIDSSARHRNRKAIELMNNFIIKYSNVHAKLCLITNNEFFITLKGSGNDTSGNRIEDFTIFTDKSVFDFYNKVILKDIIRK
jgi:hypothetical protein